MPGALAAMFVLAGIVLTIYVIAAIKVAFVLLNSIYQTDPNEEASPLLSSITTKQLKLEHVARDS